MIAEGNIIPYQTSPLPRGPWLVVAPHPDDETFGMGGTLLLAKQNGIQTHLLIMTDGALGGEASDLAGKRRREAEQVAAVLGLQTLDFLDLPDRGLTPDEALSGRLAGLIGEKSVAAVFFPSLFEPHPDHRATALIAWNALRSLKGAGRPAALSYEVCVQQQVNCLIDITSVMPEKRAAMELYASQLAENDYIDYVEAINRLRALTLPRDARYAEGFHRFRNEELEKGLADILRERIALLAG